MILQIDSIIYTTTTDIQIRICITDMYNMFIIFVYT